MGGKKNFKMEALDEEQNIDVQNTELSCGTIKNSFCEKVYEIFHEELNKAVDSVERQPRSKRCRLDGNTVGEDSDLRLKVIGKLKTLMGTFITCYYHYVLPRGVPDFTALKGDERIVLKVLDSDKDRISLCRETRTLVHVNTTLAKKITQLKCEVNKKKRLVTLYRLLHSNLQRQYKHLESLASTQHTVT